MESIVGAFRRAAKLKTPTQAGFVNWATHAPVSRWNAGGGNSVG